MNIQSLSIVVPNKKCINDCAFCVSKMHAEDVKNMMDENYPFYDLYEEDYKRRLEFARDNGCNTVMLTGNTEPQQNRAFLSRFGSMNKSLSKPFRWIEMQTTGTLIDQNYLRFLRNHVWVSTISLSMSAFDSEVNALYNGTPERFKINIPFLCSEIKRYDFNLRLSVNMTDYFNDWTAERIFEHAKELGADQVTFRILYQSTEDEMQKTTQDLWIDCHKVRQSLIDEIHQYVYKHGRPLEKLPFGQTKYSVHSMGVVIDDDCMSTEVKDDYKYLILKPDCKLYSKWDDKASLIF